MDPEYRGKGVGKAFFGELGKIAQEKVMLTHKLTIMMVVY